LQESSVDGIHPDDYGYYCWSRSIEKPLLRILRRYGIRYDYSVRVTRSTA
jgi:hypothetical protein